MEILTLLAGRGQHRAPSVPDLIIAATAGLAGLTVLHLDKDFDVIAEIRGQPTERLTLPDQGLNTPAPPCPAVAPWASRGTRPRDLRLFHRPPAHG